MYLSKLELNLRSKNVRRDLADCYQMHRTIYNCFPSKDEGWAGAIVYRVEDYKSPVQSRTHAQTVLVVSEKKPSWDKLSDSYLLGNAMLNYAEKIEGICNGNSFRFLLKANPTKKIQGKRKALRTYEERSQWMLRKSKNHGFELIDLSVKSDNVQTSSTKEDNPLTLNSVYYEGYLKVVDADLFKNALLYGIGSAKAFGFGLLSIAR